MAMELDNSFTVPVPPEQAWDVLLDVKRIAPCMPGATVDEVEGDVINGHIKVKVGPVSLTYRGTATFTERDADTRVVVLEASGKETRGAGTASATVRASLEPDASGNSTLVTMHTTMNVTGRPAQFGRGVMVEVGGKLVDQFAANLATLLGEKGPDGTAAADGGVATDAMAGTTADDAQSANGSGTAAAAHQDGADPAAGGTVTAAPPAPPAPADKQDSINLVRLVGPAILKRLVPVAAIAAALALLGRRLLRRGRAKGADET
jgi:carbon monoxide dehydrogenase subunit G